MHKESLILVLGIFPGSNAQELWCVHVAPSLESPLQFSLYMKTQGKSWLNLYIFLAQSMHVILWLDLILLFHVDTHRRLWCRDNLLA